jgi:hypothetical protein
VSSPNIITINFSQIHSPNLPTKTIHMCSCRLWVTICSSCCFFVCKNMNTQQNATVCCREMTGGVHLIYKYFRIVNGLLEMLKVSRQDHLWGPFAESKGIKIFGCVKVGYVVVKYKHGRLNFTHTVRKGLYIRQLFSQLSSKYIKLNKQTIKKQQTLWP